MCIKTLNYEDEKMNGIKIKPCPCCGTQPYTVITSVHNDKLYGYIECNNPECKLKMDFTAEAKHVLLSFEDVINGIYETTDKWNRRTGERIEDI